MQQKGNAVNSICLSILVALTCHLPALGLDSHLPPGKNFNLSQWTLQTLTPGLAFVEIQADSLSAGYTNQFFYTDSLDGSMVFLVPSDGSTTGGSDYPRCELRQSTSAGNWKLTDPILHQMSASCKVIEVASAQPITVIGQVHGSNTNSTMFQFRWNGNEAGKCYVDVRFQDNSTAGSQNLITVATGLSLGDSISYVVTMKNGTINARLNIGTVSKTVLQTYTTQYYGSSDLYYFKAGNYLQYSNSGSPEYGKVKFYHVSIDSPALATRAAVIRYNQGAQKHPGYASALIIRDGAHSFSADGDLFDIQGRCVRFSSRAKNGATGSVHSGIYFIKPQ